MKLKVLGICGSPRRKGNSEFLLKQALEEAKNVNPIEIETESYAISGKKFGPCLSCFRCIDLKGKCFQKDDFQELSEKWIDADVILYSVPVYHMGIPGQLKCFIDRLGCTLFSRYGGQIPKNFKVIGSIVQGEHLHTGQESTITDLINHALIVGAIPFSGDLWEAYIGAGGWTSNDLSKNALENQYKRGEFDATAAVRGARSTAKRAVELEIIVKSGAVQQKAMLKKDPQYKAVLDQIR